MWHPGALSSLLVTSNRYSRVHCLGRCWCHGFPIVEGGTETLKKTTKRGLVLEGRYDKLIHVYRFPWNLKGFPLLNATFLAEVVWGRYNLTRFFFSCWICSPPIPADERTRWSILIGSVTWWMVNPAYIAPRNHCWASHSLPTLT